MRETRNVNNNQPFVNGEQPRRPNGQFGNVERKEGQFDAEQVSGSVNQLASLPAQPVDMVDLYDQAKDRIEKARNAAGGLLGFEIRPMKNLPPAASFNTSARTSNRALPEWDLYVYEQNQSMSSDLWRYVNSCDVVIDAEKSRIKNSRGRLGWLPKRRRIRKDAKSVIEEYEERKANAHKVIKMLELPEEPEGS